MFRAAKSFATEANSFLNASALCGDIIAVARSIDAVGLCGVNVAEASEMLLAMPTTSAVSSRRSRSGTDQFRYPTTTAAASAAVATAATDQPKSRPVIVGADGD